MIIYIYIYTRTVNEKTGLLGQRVVTSQIKEEYPPSPTRDLYRALSPGYSPAPNDLEWQDEFGFVEYEPDDFGFKKILMPQLEMLQKHLSQEFGELDKTDIKKICSESKVNTKSRCVRETSSIWVHSLIFIFLWFYFQGVCKDFIATEFVRETDMQRETPGSPCSSSVSRISYRHQLRSSQVVTNAIN